MKLAVLFSGGKDSCLALHKVLEEGHEVKYLLNIFPETKDSFMFHKPDLKLLEKQAEMLGIKLIVVKSKGEKEKELVDLKKLISKVSEEVEGIVVGGIASDYQGSRVKNICDELGLKFIAPVLGYDSSKLWTEMLDVGFKVIITKISCEGLDSSWIGKAITRKEYEKLRELGKKYKFRIDFEGGEAETAVLWMPEMKKEIKIEFEIESEDKYRHFIRLINIK